MIFSRKYVFESRRTRALRLALNAVVMGAGLVLLYAAFLASILYTARSEQERTQQGLYQKAPDAIVVFTGDKGRIRQAVEHVRHWPEAKLLISGVHGSNTLKTITAGLVDIEALLESPVQVNIDYEAMDTLGNVRESLENLELSLSPSGRVLVVTSDYHVFRVRMLFRAHVTKQSYQIYFDGVPSDWSTPSSFKKLAIESLKLLRAWWLVNF